MNTRSLLAIVTASLAQAVVNMAVYLTCIGRHRCVAAPVCAGMELRQSYGTRQTYLRLAKRISKRDSTSFGCGATTGTRTRAVVLLDCSERAERMMLAGNIGKFSLLPAAMR